MTDYRVLLQFLIGLYLCECAFRHDNVDRACEESTSAQTLTSFTVPVESSVIDRVATFLGNPPEKSTKTVTHKRMVRPCLTVNEFTSWRESVRGCSHITQLYLVVKKISKSCPGAQFRGMKRCLADLKALKAVRNAGKHRSCRRRDNMELLQRGIVIVEKFLRVNQEDYITIGG